MFVVSMIANREQNVKHKSLAIARLYFYIYVLAFESQTGFKDNEAVLSMACTLLESGLFLDAQVVQIHLLRLSQLWGYQ